MHEHVPRGPCKIMFRVGLLWPQGDCCKVQDAHVKVGFSSFCVRQVILLERGVKLGMVCD